MFVAARGVRGSADLAAACPPAPEATDNLSAKACLEKPDEPQRHLKRAGVFSSLAALAMCVSLTSAATVQVGPTRSYKTIQTGVNAAANGDTIEIDSGTYAGNACTALIGKNDLTLRGVGPSRPVLDSGGDIGTLGASIQGKAIWVIQGSNTTVENVEFANCWVTDLNGAGIRQEGPGLTVRNCYFHDNENGILTIAVNLGCDIVIEYSEFNHNGHGDGYSHNMYIGNVRTFTLRYCWSHNSNGGQDVKTRAQVNYLLYNRISNESGDDNYEIDVPNGGTTYVIGNLIQQGPNGTNGGIIVYATEGATNPDQHCYLVNNTIVNERSWGTFVWNAGPVAMLVQNNILQGPGTLFNGSVTQVTNWITSNAYLANQAGYDYHLTAASTGAINAGSLPGSGVNGFAMAPGYQYLHPCNHENRPGDATIDIGAYEYVGPNHPPTVDAGSLQSVYEGQTVHLHAVASDPDGDPLTYAWAQKEGSIVALSGASTADASFTAPTVASVADASMTFEVTVSDGRGGTAYDIVNIWVYLAGDATHNDVVDVSDLLVLADAWGSGLGDANYNAACDFNNDGSVDVTDLLTLGGNWGRQLH